MVATKQDNTSAIIKVVQTVQIISIEFLARRENVKYNRRGLYSQIEKLSEDNKISTILIIMADIKIEADKPYDISASFGYCFDKVQNSSTIDSMIRIADEKMYIQKVKRHRARESSGKR